MAEDGTRPTSHRRRNVVIALVLLVALAVAGGSIVAAGGPAAVTGWFGPAAPQTARYLQESFETDTPGGWGTTDVPGVPWTASVEPGAAWHAAGGVGHVAVNVAGTSYHETVEGLTSMTDQEVSGRLRVDTPAPTSTGHQYLVWLRYKSPGDAYRAVLFVPTRGNDWGIRIDRIVGGEAVPLVERTATGLVFGRNGYIRFRFRATGTFPTQLSARVWQDERAEPDVWNATVNDATQPLQGFVEGFRLTTFIDPGQTTLPVTASWDDLLLTDGTRPPSEAGPAG